MATATSLYSILPTSGATFTSGEGVWLETDQGEKYLDFTAGIAVNSLGIAIRIWSKHLRRKLSSSGIFLICFKLPDKANLPTV